MRLLQERVRGAPEAEPDRRGLCDRLAGLGDGRPARRSPSPPASGPTSRAACSPGRASPSLPIRPRSPKSMTPAPAPAASRATGRRCSASIRSPATRGGAAPARSNTRHARSECRLQRGRVPPRRGRRALRRARLPADRRQRRAAGHGPLCAARETIITSTTTPCSGRTSAPTPSGGWRRSRRRDDRPARRRLPRRAARRRPPARSRCRHEDDRHRALRFGLDHRQPRRSCSAAPSSRPTRRRWRG